MKKLVFLFIFCCVYFISKANEGPSDLVIMNPYGTPGKEEVVDDFCVEFYDITGKKLNLEYIIDPMTGRITIKGGTGTVIVSVTNKKTNEKKTSKVVFVNAG
ncbi:MAG: hypothetical protein JNL75_00735 [Chitinophagales bacterium]|nr:hypothetical protein [Chitinophagales bacterium]